MTFRFDDSARHDGVTFEDVIATSSARRLDFYNSFGKRVLDVLIVLLTAPITVPLMIVLAFAISIDGHSPIYVQKRIGRNGRVFSMLKFRTMVPNADMRLKDYLSEDDEARMEWERSQKLRHDPRVTRLGSLLRKCSLDELPQIINVLMGHMSLIGPRPMMVDQADMYPGQSYYWVRPGISGLWQVTDRNDTAFTERAEYDDKYFYNMSLVNDCVIILKTFVVVIRGTGY